jgi:hypothetical protein
MNLSNPTIDPNSIYSQKELARGYSVDFKRVVLAYLAETVIVVTSLIGAWLFAVQYGHNDQHAMIMMMLAPAAFAVVEYCRVPLAISIRKPHFSFLVKFIIFLGLLGGAFITIKSVSQLGQQMFAPRLYDVVHAREQLEDARSAVAMVTKQIADADALVEQRKTELQAADQQLKISTDELGRLPKQDCGMNSGVNRLGRYSYQKCQADSRIAPLTAAISTATTNRADANSRLDEANSQRKLLDRAEGDKTLRAEQLNYREAVLNSQLHSFAAMVFGVEPTEVTDTQIHLFLRIFVFIPAIGSAFAATIIALTAVTRIKVRPTHVEIPDDGGEYLLGPVATNIIQRATEDHIKAAWASVPKPEPVQAPIEPTPAKPAQAEQPDRVIIPMVPRGNRPGDTTG